MSWRTIIRGTVEEEKPDPESIYCPQNKYAYHVNIAHPVARYFLEEYKKEIGAGAFPLSDMERHDYERRFFNWIANNNLQIGAGGKLLDVSMKDGKPVIDFESRNNRIREIIAERGEYKPAPTFDVPDFVKQEMADRRKVGTERFAKQMWEKE